MEVDKSRVRIWGWLYRKNTNFVSQLVTKIFLFFQMDKEREKEWERVSAQDFVFLFPDVSRDHIDLAHLQQIAGFSL